MSKQYFVYILSSTSSAVLYVGVTNNLLRRLEEHRSKVVAGFTSKYHVSKLVYYELIDDVVVALEREKQIKRWARMKKKHLIEQMNPEWKDLAGSF